MNENISKKQINNRKKYSPQFKDQAVERAAKVGVPQAAKDLGIGESMLYYWRTQKIKVGIRLKIKKFSKQKWQG